MTNKIFISHWAQGQKNVSEITLFLIDNFVKTVKKWSPDLEIVFTTDSITKKQVSKYVLDNTTIRLSLDKFNTYPKHTWAIVKLLVISEIEEEEVFHIDYDIVWNYDINIILNAIRKSGADVVYQKTESILHPYYSDYLRNDLKKENIFKGLTRKVAFNAGVSYFKTKKLRESYLDILKNTPDNFDKCVAIEQLVIPNLLEKSGAIVKTLTNYLPQLPLVQNKNKYEGLENLTKQEYLEYCGAGVFMENIQFFHFCGSHFKGKPNILEIVKYFSKLD